MLSIHEEPGTNIIYTTAIGKLDQNDYDRLLPLAEAIIKREGSIRWYFEMEDFDGWTTGTAWRDLKFDVRHASDFEKVAIVGRQEWMRWATEVMQPFTSGEVEHFSLEEQAAAKAWIQA